MTRPSSAPSVSPALSDTQKVAIGRTVDEAEQNFKTLIAEMKATGFVPGTGRVIKEAQGKVTRISQEVSDGQSRFFLMIDQVPTKIFDIPKAVSPEILITQPGDPVVMTFFDTTQERVAVKNFDNLNLNLSKSEPQKIHEKAVATEKAESRAEVEKRANELKEQMESLQEQLKELKGAESP